MSWWHNLFFALGLVGRPRRALGAVLVAAAVGASGAAIYSQTNGGSGTFPLKVSANGRYLETNGGQPFLLASESSQSTIGNLSVTNANTFLDNRASHGFNGIWINLLCGDYTYCNSNGKAVGDGGGQIAPFTVGSGFSTYTFGADCANCNTAYFSRAHDIVAHAQDDGIAVLLDPIPTDACYSGGWIDAVNNNGDGTTGSGSHDYQYGAWLGDYFKDLDNVIWMSGNDYECWTDTTTNNNVTAVGNGIASSDPTVMQTMEMKCADATCPGSTSLDNTTFASLADVNAVYAYSPTYSATRRGYAQSPTTPMFMVEANYEEGNNPGTDGCLDIRICRLQEWWTMTSGATGQLYGCYCTTHLLNSDFPLGANVNTPGVTEFENVAALLAGRPWYDLAPDANGAGHLVTTGGGTCPGTGLFASVTCVTAAETADQHLALVFAPGPSSDQSFTVDFGKMASGGTTTARWYDPASGSFTTVTGSPFTNASGAVSITAGNGSANSASDHDWVLLLESS